MTNKEALKILPDMKGAGDDWDKAIDLAIEALKQAESSQQTAVGSQGLVNDTVSRQGAIDAIEKAKTAKTPDGEMYVAKINAEMNIQLLPSVQPEPLSDAYMKAVWTWLLDYQIKAAELKGRYTPYEVLSWVANDWRKEHE